MKYHTLRLLAARDNRRRMFWRAAEYALGFAALIGGFAAVYALAAILTVLASN